MDFETRIENITSDIVNKKLSDAEVKVMVYEKNILPIYKIDEKLMYVTAFDLTKNVYGVSKRKCKLLFTKGGVKYYELIPNQDDIDVGIVPMRPIGCTSLVEDLNITELSKFNYITSLKK